MNANLLVLPAYFCWSALLARWWSMCVSCARPLDTTVYLVAIEFSLSVCSSHRSAWPSSAFHRWLFNVFIAVVSVYQPFAVSKDSILFSTVALQSICSPLYRWFAMQRQLNRRCRSIFNVDWSNMVSLWFWCVSLWAVFGRYRHSLVTWVRTLLKDLAFIVASIGSIDLGRAVSTSSFFFSASFSFRSLLSSTSTSTFNVPSIVWHIWNQSFSSSSVRRLMKNVCVVTCPAVSSKSKGDV